MQSSGNAGRVRGGRPILTYNGVPQSSNGGFAGNAVQGILPHSEMTSHTLWIKNILSADQRWSQRLRIDPGRTGWFRVAAFLAHSGDSWFWEIGLFIVWLLTQGEWHSRAALLAAGIFGLAMVVIAIKFTVRRQRPAGEWGAIYRNTDPHSFPSGHAARAALLVVMTAGLGPPWLAAAILVWAPLVSVARVATGVHYLSDLLAGFVVGAAAGFFMLAIAPLLVTWIPWIFA